MKAIGPGDIAPKHLISFGPLVATIVTNGHQFLCVSCALSLCSSLSNMMTFSPVVNFSRTYWVTIELGIYWVTRRGLYTYINEEFTVEFFPVKLNISEPQLPTRLLGRPRPRWMYPLIAPNLIAPYLPMTKSLNQIFSTWFMTI